MKEGNLPDTPQREEGVTYAPMLKKEDGRIDWSDPADVVERKIRAFDPWPSAYTFWRGQLIKIFRAAVMESGEEFLPGEVVRADCGGLWVATGCGLLDLREVQLENRKRLLAEEFLKGARIEKGERL
jgi:methionyl-tRNA formyltransferase